MFTYHENARQNFDTERYMEKVENLGMTLSNNHCLPREIKSRLNSGYALDSSFRNLYLSFTV